MKKLKAILSSSFLFVTAFTTSVSAQVASEVVDDGEVLGVASTGTDIVATGTKLIVGAIIVVAMAFLLERVYRYNKNKA